jgi:PAS domain S-box-containing protein
MVRKIRIMLVLGLAGILLLSYSSGLTAERGGTVKVVGALYEPFLFYEDGELKGFDVDILNIICTAKGLDCPIHITSFGEALREVQTGEADLAIGAIYRTPEREKRLIFTRPYLHTGLVPVFRVGEYHDLKHLTGRKVGVKKGATGELIAGRLAGAGVVAFDSTEESFEALSRGDVDVLLNDYINSVYLILEKYSGQLIVGRDLKGPLFLQEAELAFPVNPERRDLLRIFNDKLEELGKGMIEKDLSIKWFSFSLPFRERDLGTYVKVFFIFTIIILVIALWISKSVAVRRELKNLNALFGSCPDAIIIERLGRIIYTNPRGEELTGFSREALNERKFDEIISAECRKGLQQVRRRLNEGSIKSAIWEGRLMSGGVTGVDVEIALTIFRYNGEKALQMVIRDISEKKELESQFLQAQRMEAIGRLASGVAHDFRNILSAIMGYSELALMRTDPGNPLIKYLETIHDASTRASRLTEQLLVFSRRGVVKPEIVNLNTVVMDMKKMLERMIGEDVEIKTDLDDNLMGVIADTSNMEQVIMNLAINARDAMPLGGRLAIATKNEVLAEEIQQVTGKALPGRYVVLSVSDTGIGSPESLIENIFEPFFTTKEKGRGTGLGLSTVYGIVTQIGGFIDIKSRLGEGTIFRIYLPAHDAINERGVQLKEENYMIPGNETILLAEDDQEVRALIYSTLSGLGYNVLVASNGKEALELCYRYEGSLHLLLTDVVMPGMGGGDLSREIRILCPGIKVIYMSGYTEDAIVKQGILKEGTEFVRKPVTPRKIARIVRKTLDSIYTN